MEKCKNCSKLEDQLTEYIKLNNAKENLIKVLKKQLYQYIRERDTNVNKRI